MSARAISEARTVTEARSVKRKNSKKKVSFSNIINVRILYPDDMNKSDTLTTVQLANRLTPESLSEAVQLASRLTPESLSEAVQPKKTVNVPVPIIARDIKKKQLKEDITIDTIYLSDVSDVSDVSTYNGDAIKFARNLVDVILKHANSCQTDMVYLP